MESVEPEVHIPKEFLVKSFALANTIQSLLYGGYFVLFGICIHILIRRSTKAYRLYCIPITFLFVLATAAFILSVLTSMKEILVGFTDVHYKLVYSRVVLLIASNATADAILIWRCYLVWGKRKKIIAFPYLCCLANNFLAIVSLALSVHSAPSSPIRDATGLSKYQLYWAFLLITFFTNVILTLLIAGRIFYMSREATKYYGRDADRTYKTVLAITLESGLIYPVTLIAYVVAAMCEVRSDDMNFHTSYAQMTSAAAQYSLHQVVGIAPTLVIVRTGLGISIESTESFVLTSQALDIDENASTSHIIDVGQPTTPTTIGGSEAPSTLVADIEKGDRSCAGRLPGDGNFV